MEIASIKIEDYSFNYELIGKAAGQSPTDIRYITDGYLMFEGVTQEVLDQALANYNHVDNIKALALADVDKAASNVFRDLDDKIIAIHNAKYQEAVKLVADPTLNPPIIMAESTAIGVDKVELANVIINKYDEYIACVADVESVRIDKKGKISRSTTSNSINTHRDVAVSLLAEIKI